jgi:hypothetical protein
MQSTLNPPRTDPHDLLEIAPDVVLVARAEHELSKLARDVKRRPPQPQPQITSDSSAGSSVPSVDTTFRASATNHGPSLAARAVRGLVGLLLALCIGIAAVAWKTYGEVAGQVVAGLLPEFAAKSVPPAESQALAQSPSQPAAQESQEAAAPQPSAPQTPASTQTAAAQDSAAPPAATSPDQTQLMQSMARDLASVSRELAQLKASVAELKASQEQLSHDVAKVSEQQRERVRMSALPGRPAAPAARRPPPFRAGQAAAAPVNPPAPYAPPPPVAAAPSVLPPQPMAQPPVDPDVPRPPMPVR